MNYIVIPALLALSAKLVVLAVSSTNNSDSKLFLPMLALFSIHNFCEILALWGFSQGIDGVMLLKVYYALTVIGWCMIFFYVAEITKLDFTKSKALLTFIGVLLLAAIAFSDFILNGASSLNYSITATRGDFYFVWQVFCFAAAVGTCAVLWTGFKSANDHQLEIRCVYTAFALTPLVLLSLALLALMALGYQVNAVVVMPVATTLFLIIMLASEYQHKLTDVRRFLPWSGEHKTSQKILDIFSDYSRDNIDYREAVGEIERLLVLQKYDKNLGNASETANKMGMPRSSLYSIFNRLKIESRGDRH